MDDYLGMIKYYKHAKSTLSIYHFSGTFTCLTWFWVTFLVHVWPNKAQTYLPKFIGH